MNDYLTAAARLALALCATGALMAPLPTQAEDNSVKRRLDSVGQKYEVDKDGDFKITYNFPDEKRSQIAFVSGTPYDVADGVQVRNIFAPVAKVKDDGVAGKAVDLLKANYGYKIGAYEISGDVLYLSIKVPDNASAAQLKKAVQIAVSVADNKEKELSGARDTF